MTSTQNLLKFGVGYFSSASNGKGRMSYFNCRPQETDPEFLQTSEPTRNDFHVTHEHRSGFEIGPTLSNSLQYIRSPTAILELFTLKAT